MTTPNGIPPKADSNSDTIDQAMALLEMFSGGSALTNSDDRNDDATALLAAVGIAIAGQLRRIADSLEVRSE